MFVEVLNNSDGSNEEKKHFLQAQQFKTQGNGFYHSKDFRAAVKCYSIAISHLSHIVDHNKYTYKLLDILSSKQAISF